MSCSWSEQNEVLLVPFPDGVYIQHGLEGELTKLVDSGPTPLLLSLRVPICFELPATLPLLRVLSACRRAYAAGGTSTAPNPRRMHCTPLDVVLSASHVACTRVSLSL